MPDTKVVRVDALLADRAEAAGELMGRTLGAQITHWARLGRAVEAGGASTPAVARVLAERAGFDDLDHDEQAEVIAEWERRMEDAIAALDLAAEFDRTGAAYAELDDDGNVVVRNMPVGGDRPESTAEAS